jgi:hypothetical protein
MKTFLFIVSATVLVSVGAIATDAIIKEIQKRLAVTTA